MMLSEEQLISSKKERLKKNVDVKVLTLYKPVLNTLSNLIPNVLIECDDKDPPWFNAKIKTLGTIYKLRN